MKRFLLPFILFLSFLASYGQPRVLDSLNRVFRSSHDDTVLAQTYLFIMREFAASNPDTIPGMAEKAITMTDIPLKKAKGRSRNCLLICKAAAISNLGYFYYLKGDVNKALEHYEKSQQVQLEAGDVKESANTLNNIGTILMSKGESTRALEYFEKALKMQENMPVHEGMATTLSNIGTVYDCQGQFHLALDYLFRALKLFEASKDKRVQASTLNNIGMMYYRQDERQKALEFFQRSLKMREEINDLRGLGQSYNNIGGLYLKDKKMDMALDYFKKSGEFYRKVGNRQGIAYHHVNMGSVFKMQGKYDEALIEYNAALKLYEEIKDKKGTATCLNNMGFTFISMKKIGEARKNSEKALMISGQAGYPEILRDCHLALMRMDSISGKNEQALSHYKDYVFFRDSLINVNTRKAGMKKDFQYEFEKKEEIAKREQEKKEAIHAEEMKRESIIRWSSVSMLSLGFLSVLLFFNRIRLKQKNRFQEELNKKQKEQADAVLEVQEQERKRIAEDLHDSLGHLLSAAKLNLQTSPSGAAQIENSLTLLSQASEEIRNITFNLMPKTLEEEGLVPALEELATRVTRTGVVKANLHIHDIGKFVLEKQSQFNIYRIVQEAVNNILKHANATEINIQLIGQDNHVTIMIEDDGKGFDPKNNKEGRGLKNIVTRSLWLKGNINIDSSPGHGTTITTEIPVE